MKIEVNKNRLKITEYTKDEYKIIQKYFTVSVAGAFFSDKYKSGVWDGTKKFYKTTSTGIFMSKGYINILEQLFPNSEVVEQKSPVVHIKEVTQIGDKILREYQVEAVNSLSKNHNIGILNIATNGGKTVTALTIARELIKLGKKVMFITHSKEIGMQVIEVSRKLLGEDLVGVVGFSKEEYDKPFTLGLVHTLVRRIEKNIKFFKSIEAIIVDECHHCVSNVFQKVINSCNNKEYTIGLTGTVPTDKQSKLELYKIVGSPIIKTSNEELIEKAVSTEPICKITTIFSIELEDRPIHTYETAYRLGITLNKARNKEIVEIVKEERKQYGSQILILVEFIEHGEELYKFLLKEDMETKLGVIEFIHGSSNKEDRSSSLKLFSEGVVNVLIATSILDEGVDISNIDAIIYARGGKSPRKLLQSIGRGLRKKEGKSSISLYDFLDSSSEYLIEHSRQRIKTMKNEKFKIVRRQPIWRDSQ